MEEPCVLIVPQIENNDGEVTAAGLYRLQASQGAATLVDAMLGHSFSRARQEAAHDLAHCDGLVLAPTDAGGVRVLNPATGRVLALPLTAAPPRLPAYFIGYQAFGLGHDQRTGTYKVARFFYRSLNRTRTGGYSYELGADVFTIGTGQWRETAAPPPYPVIPGRTATFFQGSLLLTVDESVLDAHHEAPGFVRFSLEDESFSVVPGPPCNARRMDYAASSLAELRGELWMCVTNPGSASESVEMWTSSALDAGDTRNTPRWERRHVIEAPVFPRLQALRPITVSDGTMLLHAAGTHYLFPYHGHGLNYDGMVRMECLKYHRPDDIVEYPRRTLHGFDVIPYVPTLVPI